MKQSKVYNLAAAAYLLAVLFFMQFLDGHLYMALILIMLCLIAAYSFSGLADDTRCKEREESLLEDLMNYGTGND